MKGGSPNEVLEKIRAILISDELGSESSELMDLVEELDNWLTGGGPLPEDWSRIRDMMAPPRG